MPGALVAAKGDDQQLRSLGAPARVGKIDFCKKQ